MSKRTMKVLIIAQSVETWHNRVLRDEYPGKTLEIVYADYSIYNKLIGLGEMPDHRQFMDVISSINFSEYGVFWVPHIRKETGEIADLMSAFTVIFIDVVAKKQNKKIRMLTPADFDPDIDEMSSARHYRLQRKINRTIVETKEFVVEGEEIKFFRQQDGTLYGFKNGRKKIVLEYKGEPVSINRDRKSWNYVEDFLYLKRIWGYDKLNNK